MQFNIGDIVMNTFTKELWTVTGFTATYYILNNYYHMRIYKDPYGILVKYEL